MCKLVLSIYAVCIWYYLKSGWLQYIRMQKGTDQIDYFYFSETIEIYLNVM